VAKMTVTCTAWRAFPKNTLLGFAVIHIEEMGLVIHDVGLHESHGKFWAALPAKPWVKGLEVLTDDSGKIKYAQLLEFPRDEVRAVVDAVRRFDPNALASAERVT
jgi:hypothetical protein